MSPEETTYKKTLTSNKVYRCKASDLPKIKHLFWGYIFNRVENDTAYIKCNRKDAMKILSANILIEEVK
tara:strand:- start:163 stop:369 length:207 start_codon:yes stop_codon:yes gene_type:complete